MVSRMLKTWAAIFSQRILFCPYHKKDKKENDVRQFWRFAAGVKCREQRTTISKETKDVQAASKVADADKRRLYELKKKLRNNSILILVPTIILF